MAKFTYFCYSEYICINKTIENESIKNIKERTKDQKINTKENYRPTSF